MHPIRVIGLGARRANGDWHALLDGYQVVLRHEASSRAVLPSWLRAERTYDHLFDAADPPEIVEAIAEDLIARALRQPVAYLVPSLGWAGDVTVDVLQQRVAAHVLAGGPPDAPRGVADVQIVDALALALSELFEPFGAGFAPLDPTTGLLVTNWYSSTTTSLARQRLDRLGFAPSEPREGADVWCAPADTLDASRSFNALRQIYARLRRPDGCPWDREQTELTILPHIAEEAEELREALERQDWEHAAEEFGDVLGNLLMIAQIAHEHGRFNFEDAVGAVSAKLIRRHPHVFGDQMAANAEEVLAIWQRAKAAEKKQETRPLSS